MKRIEQYVFKERRIKKHRKNENGVFKREKKIKKKESFTKK